MAVRRLNHAVLYVRDLARTVSFYRETLGFELRTEVPGRAVMWRVPAEDWDEELRKGSMIPLDLDEAVTRWGDRITAAAAGSAT
jgi:catechol 2,3-dioxygenase-like lactoylglutathione lyase family enzyme